MDTNIVRNMIRIGRVSSVDPACMTARVVFNDKDNDVSYDLPVLAMCARSNKEYHLPDIDTQVVCLFLPNISSKGLTTGFVIGSFYSDVDKPSENGAGIKSIRFADGSYVRYERGNIEVYATENISIVADGNIKLKGSRIDIN